MALGLSTDSSSRISGWRYRLLNVKQSPVAAEACSERGHPPVATRRLFVERGLQHEVHARTADVAIVAQNRRAPSRVIFGETNLLADRRENFAAAGVQHPPRDVVAR